MNETEWKVIDFLKEHGKMSRCDIKSATGIDDIDLDFMQLARLIVRKRPAHGGAGVWYDVNPRLSRRTI